MLFFPSAWKHQSSQTHSLISPLNTRPGQNNIHQLNQILNIRYHAGAIKSFVLVSANKMSSFMHSFLFLYLNCTYIISYLCPLCRCDQKPSHFPVTHVEPTLPVVRRLFAETVMFYCQWVFFSFSPPFFGGSAIYADVKRQTSAWLLSGGFPNVCSFSRNDPHKVSPPLKTYIPTNAIFVFNFKRD